jgi:hypothetical protein
VEIVRDLARADPWRESLERSLARREKSKRSSTRQNELRRDHRLARQSACDSASHGGSRCRAIVKRSMIALTARGTVALALLAAALLASVFEGHGPQASASAVRESGPQAVKGGPDAPPAVAAPVHGRRVGVKRTCPFVVSSTGYVNPLAGAAVTPERIDQGVDYAGSGMLVAIGAAKVTYLAMSGTGWPGPFIEYQLRDGPDAGCYVFYAEGVLPAHGLRVGQTLSAGQTIASIIPGYPSGIEIGWGAGANTKTYAAAAHQWSTTDDQDNIPTAAGKSFSALIASLGGPPGKVEG